MPDPDAAVPTVGDPAQGSMRLPLSPIGADRIRWTTVAVTLAAALALGLGAAAGRTTLLWVVLALSLVLAWSWPVVSGSATPRATSVALALSALAVVPTALRDDLRWMPAAVAFGIILSFFSQLLRRPTREDLTLTLLASFGGLVAIASAATAIPLAVDDLGRSVLVVGAASAAAAVVADLLAGARRISPLLGFVALAAAVIAALVAANLLGEVEVWTAFGIGAATGSISWAVRRILVLQPAMVTLRGQTAAGLASVLLVGALLRAFAAIS